MELDFWTIVVIFLALFLGSSWKDIFDMMMSDNEKDPEEYDKEMEELHGEGRYDPLLKGSKKEGKDD